MGGSMICSAPALAPRPLTYLVCSQFGKCSVTTSKRIPTSNVNVIHSSATVAPPIIHRLPSQIQPSPELGLLSLFFVLSTAIGAIFSLAIISIPTMNAFRRLGGSMDNLSKLVSQEVPGTLSSLKLSALEINELTQQLTLLRQKLSPTQRAHGNKINMPTSFGTSNYPVVH